MLVQEQKPTRSSPENLYSEAICIEYYKIVALLNILSEQIQAKDLIENTNQEPKPEDLEK